MDNLAKQLSADAEKIDVQISDELDRRIMASIHATSPVRPAPAPIQQRPAAFWWASSLTGIAAALAVIAIINSQSPQRDVIEEVANHSPVTESIGPSIDWRAESAMVTRPLQRELEDLQSDIKKAEDIVKQEIGL